MVSRRPIAAHVAALYAILCLPFPCAASASANVAHHKKHDLKMEVEGMEEQWRQAQIAGDVSAMDRLLSDDYVGISMNGEVNNKAQQLDRLRTRSVLVSSIDISDVKVKLLGPVAIVTSLASVAGTNQGQPLNGMYRYTRVYQHLPNGSWKITNFELTLVHPHGGRYRPNPTQAANRPTS